LVERHRMGRVLPPRNEEAIASFLEGELRAFQAGTRPLSAKAVDIARYDRRVQASEFADVFRDAAALAGIAGARPEGERGASPARVSNR
ncbi:MAG TPA: hypothetical protein VGI39_43400, partial [Polyangiaceae bacterium]